MSLSSEIILFDMSWTCTCASEVDDLATLLFFGRSARTSDLYTICRLERGEF